MPQSATSDAATSSCVESGFRTAGLQRAGQISRFGGDMGTGDQLDAGKWLFGLKSLADEPKYRHFAVRPFDTLLALRSQIDVFYIVVH
jgi:hypothetical protein